MLSTGQPRALNNQGLYLGCHLSWFCQTNGQAYTTLWFWMFCAWDHFILVLEILLVYLFSLIPAPTPTHKLYHIHCMNYYVNTYGSIAFALSREGGGKYFFLNTIYLGVYVMLFHNFSVWDLDTSFTGEHYRDKTSHRNLSLSTETKAAFTLHPTPVNWPLKSTSINNK